jgi:methyl-accepting chemotaxis protein
VVSAKVQSLILRSLTLLAIVFLVSFSLVVIFVKRSIGQPIAALLAGVKKVSEGDFDHRIEELPVDEFNELASNVNIMSDALKNREEEIRRNYQELENIHNDLHSSYLKLESLSLDLEKSEELYKSLLEDASDAIVVIDENDIRKGQGARRRPHPRKYRHHWSRKADSGHHPRRYARARNSVEPRKERGRLGAP